MRKSKKRRGRGEGSIYYRESDGRWVGAVVVGYAADTGRPIRKVVYGDTKQQVQDALDELRQKAKAGEDKGEALPLRHAMEFWLDCHIKPKVDPATHRLYQQLIRDHITPRLGHMPVARITPFMVKDWFDNLEAKGHTANLRQRCGKLLRACLDHCVDFGYVRTNPAKKLTLPRGSPKEMHPLDAGQAARFLAVAVTHRLAALWLLALDSGMRQGEMLALTWPDIEFEAGTVSVTKSVRTEKKGEARVKEVKTKASRRRIRLTKRTLGVLKARKEAHGGRLVFGTPGRGARRGQERYLRKNAVLATFRRLLARAGLPMIRFHDLRHTHATLALAATKNVKAVSARLGHADIAVTLNVYAHYLPLHEEEYVAAVEKLLEPVQETAIAKVGE